MVIEEPEAHLHPRAQRILAKLIAKAVNKFKKTVLITTHSDYLLYSINNLIALSKFPEKAKKLGFHRDEALSPDKVATYLVKAVEAKAELQRLKVSSEGISEEEFTKVAEELVEERAELVPLK